MTNRSSDHLVAIRLLLIAWVTAAAIAIVAGAQMLELSSQARPGDEGYGVSRQAAAAPLMARSAP